MKERILRIFGSVLIILFISCSKPEVECSLDKITEYANEYCAKYGNIQECKKEVIHLIGVTCGIN